MSNNSSASSSARSSLRSTSSSSSFKASSSSSAPSTNSQPSLPPTATSSGSKSRPSSHHRRKSSVSTRRESAEIMGVAIPTTDDDDQQDVSREELRKRALLALEGRSSSQSSSATSSVLPGFSRVEIPEWKTPSLEKTSFDWEPPANLPNLIGLGKRDSFGRNTMSVISAKAELGTLVEEDEDEEEGSGDLSPPSPVSVTRSNKKIITDVLPIPTTQITNPTPPHKPRPASLVLGSLRRLSLVGDLPTPVSTPSPRTSLSGIPIARSSSPSGSPAVSGGGMRPLTLIPSPSPSLSLASSPNGVSQNKRGSLMLTPSSPVTPSPSLPISRPGSESGSGSWGNMSNSGSGSGSTRRQSQLSYRGSSSRGSSLAFDSPSSPSLSLSPELTQTGLPPISYSLRTPQSSISSTVSSSLPNHSRPSFLGHERPLSPTESFAQQAFNKQAHASLLDRIKTLEEALGTAQAQVQALSSSTSTASDLASPTSTAAEEELIALVATLKTSRDTLHSKLQESESKVSDLERSGEVIKRRLEEARREAWNEKDKADLLGVEVERLRSEVISLEKKVKDLEAQVAKAGVLEKQLATERQRVAELEAEVESLKAHQQVQLRPDVSSNTARQSLDSQSSTATSTTFAPFEEETLPISKTKSATSVPMMFSTTNISIETPLDVVAEEEEHDDLPYEDNNTDDHEDETQSSDGLASYEDEPAGFDQYIHDTLDMDDDDEMMEDFNFPVQDPEVAALAAELDDTLSTEDSFESRPLSASNISRSPSTFKFPSTSTSASVNTFSSKNLQPAPQVQQQPKSQSTQGASHAHRASLVVSWRFPPGPSVKDTAKSSLADPFLSSTPSSFSDADDDDEEDFDSPRFELLGRTPVKREKKTRVEITPALADSFAMNFGLDDEESEVVPSFGFVADYEEQKVTSFKFGGSKASNTFSEPIREEPVKKIKTPTSSDPLVPPVQAAADKPLYKLASIVPLVPKEAKDATAAPTVAATPTVLPSTPKRHSKRLSSQNRPPIVPPTVVFSPAPTATSSAQQSLSSLSKPKLTGLPPPSSYVAPQSLSSPRTSSDLSASSGNDSFSFSYFSNSFSSSASSSSAKPRGSLDDPRLSTPVEKSRPVKNVVTFPTTSASPFSMASGVLGGISGGLASLMPWSPTRNRTAAPSSSLQASISAVTGQERSSFEGPKPQSKGGVVDPNVMRERLRARLVQEGKLKNGGVAGSAPPSRAVSPPPSSFSQRR